MKKSISQQVRPKFQTRKGTKPNTAKGKLVTIKLGDEVKRVHESQAVKMLGAGWEYCPKSEYKKSLS